MAKRIIGSIKKELLKKSREAALAAIQIFNNPNISFKSESFIVLIIIAWTYLFHAYYREKNIDYRYFEKNGKRKIFDKTKYGAYKHWELTRCIDDNKSPIDKDTSNNLKFLIKLRNEIEHQMTTKIDDLLSAKFQACCLNYNFYFKQLFSDKFGIEKHLSFSLQFSKITTEQKELLLDYEGLPPNIQAFLIHFDGSLTNEEFSNPRFAYRVFFVPKTANRKGQADKVIEFVKENSGMAIGINQDKERIFLKETEKKKYFPTEIIEIMKSEGYTKFSMHYHTKLWKNLDAKNPSKQYGALVAGKTWFWYELWVEEVRKHCISSKSIYC